MLGFNGNIFKLFLIIALPLIFLWCINVFNNMYVEKKFTLEKIVAESMIYDKNTSVLITNHMNEVYENLKVIRDSNEMNDFLDAETDETKTEFIDLLIRIMSNKEDFNRVIYIDVEGKQSVQVDNEGNSLFISNEIMEDQKVNDTFKYTIALAYGEILVSSMRLNVKDGQIKIPYEPVLEFSTVVKNSRGERKGILVVIYNAESVFDMFSVHRDFEEIQSSNFYVLNKEGGFIIHPDASKNFSFVFDMVKSTTMQQENAAIWLLVNDDVVGYSELDDKLIMFYDVLQGVRERNKRFKEKWIFVHEMDISALLSFESVFKNLFLTRNLIVIIIIAFLSYILAMAFERLRSKDYQLEITQKIADTTNDAVLITDSKSIITYVNPAYEVATGYSRADVIGDDIREFNSDKLDSEFYTKMWREINEKGYWEGTIWDKKKDGLIYPKKLKIIAIKDKSGKNILNYISVFSDLSENKKNGAFYRTLDYSEGKMQLPNEKMMIELLKQSINRENHKFMVLSIIIENNNQLRTIFRETEYNTSEIFVKLITPLLGDQDFVAQTGRSIFAVIINLASNQFSPQNHLQEIYKELTKVININEQKFFFKIRIGVSFWPDDTEDLKKLILNSIIALEWSSSHPENEIAYFSTEMIEVMNKENEIEGYLRTAIENDELFLVYQPQIDIETNEIIGMEALLRWNGKDIGFVPPDRFIPIAEKSHLIIDIGNWVIHKVCEDMEYLNKNFIGLNETIRCAINLSPVQMEEKDFLEKLYNMIEQYDVENSQLELEITESLLLSNEVKNIRNIENIRNRGIKIAIDDFGTGYSSLSYLNRLPIDKIKVDRTFIKNYPYLDDGKLAGILVNMAKALGIEVLMEGAETQEQVEFLKKIGCDYIQGYYYSKPLVFKDFLSYLKNINRGHDKKIIDSD